jgi:hypothetical protein
VVKKAHQRLFNLRRLRKFGLSPKTLTNFYRCTIKSILSGSITAWYGNCTALKRKALQRVVQSAHHITGGQTTCPSWHLQHPMSQEGQKDYQGQQPPEPLPVHTAIIQKARSVQLHQSWDREIEKQLPSQGHQTAKQQSLTQRGCCLHWEPITEHFNNLITSHFKQCHFKYCHFNNVYISYITHITYTCNNWGWAGNFELRWKACMVRLWNRLLEMPNARIASKVVLWDLSIRGAWATEMSKVFQESVWKPVSVWKPN